MSAVATGAPGTTSLRRARVLGVIFILAGVAIAFFFGVGADPGADSTLVLNAARAETFFSMPNLVLPSAGTAYVLSAICFALGGWQLAKGFEKRANLVLSLVALMFVFGFLVWAAEGRSLSLIGMLQSTVCHSVVHSAGLNHYWSHRCSHLSWLFCCYCVSLSSVNALRYSADEFRQDHPRP